MSEFNSSADPDDTNKANSELINLILSLLINPRLPEDLQIDKELSEDPDFRKLYGIIIDLRELSSTLHQGDLQKFVTGKGFILANLKSLQSNLRHLTWQTKKVAAGDFSQRVDFLGEFSNSFNEMTIKLRDSTSQLMKLATLDVLTQLPNRRALEQFLIHAFEMAKEKSTAFTILMFDLDHFKRVNDTYGHDAGDKVLKEVSGIINKQFRSSDVFARYGGEEFIAALPDTPFDIALKIADRALKAVEETAIQIDETTEINMTVSIGVSELNADDTSYNDIIKRSDIALYKAKRNGRNQICIT